MCNCNQQRTIYATASIPLPKGMVKVKLVKGSAVVVNGDITGRMYVFRNINDTNWVDKRDMAGLKEWEGLQVFY